MQLNDLEQEDEEFQNFLKQVTLSKKPDENKQAKNNDERIAVRPEPGFCLKTKRIGDEANNEKVFINVCMSSQINAPREITEEELIEIVKSEDPGRYRVPISLGEPMADLDKHGQACTIFTVIIHPDFYRRAHSSPTFMNFLLTLMYEGLESKYPQFKLDTGKSNDNFAHYIIFVFHNTYVQIKKHQYQ
ncbi:unnamed protein product [Rotaria socialis]|uniref:PIH1 N-terminal domain-containing protein n=1 Tax=Rotaria socialis TaxID=392032 RepID=A0A818XE78_9BILA|nr:unnamed protein product [Rotaria socialis]CAF3363545.1 unnamed protein product [Rotaria socialis]CAF3386951.1 unnamed protein product [Rotaria socialis]CAF3597695.1 unnamed protein product [Rotaria socialis]CAF3736296.1 unnamed protein product [Rotaria socialis]